MTSEKNTESQVEPSRSVDVALIANRLAEAVSIHRQGRPEEAAEKYRAILDGAPGQVDALHFLGIAEHQMGNSEKALDCIGRALVLCPDHPDALNNRGNIFKRLGRLDEAEADYRRVLSLRPTDPSALNNLGTVLRCRGDLEGAVAVFREVIKTQVGHAPAWQNLGNALGELGRPHEAIEFLWEAIRLEPRDADSYRSLGLMLSGAGKTDKALEVYRRWLELFPDDPRPKHHIAACTREAVPLRASDDYVRTTFDLFAESFDEVLARLKYRAPALVEEEVTRILGAPEPRLAVLDAGCGTGLCASFLRPRASFLAGVDLSPAMIDMARKRALFDVLVVEELVAHLGQNADAYDLIVSADTLVYFGDLSQAMRAARRALRPGGVLVFTVERASKDEAPEGFRLNLHGRYSHTRDYVLRVLADAGLSKPAVQEVTLRMEGPHTVDGWLCSARLALSGDELPDVQ